MKNFMRRGGASGARKAMFAAALLAAVCLALAGPASAQTRGGNVYLGIEQDIAGFDPLVVGVYDTGAISTAALLFDTLTRIDDEGVVRPRLALSWSDSPDFKTWTFKLRPGVKFHDGTPFNAQAVALNISRMKDPANHCRCAFYLAETDKVEADGDLTVVWRLKTPGVDLPGLLSPPAVTNVIHSPTALKSQTYNRNPVGTGPFKLKSWASGDRLVLERNPDYWNKCHPYLDSVTVRPLPRRPVMPVWSRATPTSSGMTKPTIF
jgi:4-phytase/acid phosphatase/peptide/nickel transport system substrate-binding protein